MVRILIKRPEITQAFLAGSFILLFVFGISRFAHSNCHQLHIDPALYIKQKLKTNDIVFLGTTQRKPPILKFIKDLIPRLKDAGVTRIGLEIPSDQQGKIDKYMNNGNGLMNIYLHPQIDCPEYRDFLKTLHGLNAANKLSNVTRLPRNQTAAGSQRLCRAL